MAARAKALDLLKALQAAKAGSDASARDLFKKVTGTSSVENSIAATRRAIEAYDKVMVELGAEPPMVSMPSREVRAPA